ncbi:kinesin motor catalytic domain protein [Sesbania bispinosa]|nr:kinesin motor catalytic domain protein [Sesbania bispinosa]
MAKYLMYGLQMKQELETTTKTYEVQCSQLEEATQSAKAELRQKSQEYEHRLEEVKKTPFPPSFSSQHSVCATKTEKNRERTRK